MGSVKGIVVDIGGDTTKLEQAIKGVNKTSRELKTELKEVEKGLKFDPSNTELLWQKQTILAESIQNTTQKLETLKKAEESAKNQLAKGEIGTEQMRALQREILATENQLSNLTKQATETKSSLRQVGKNENQFTELTRQVTDASDSLNQISEKINNAGENISNLGGKLTAGLTIPLATFTAGAIKVGSEFEKSMSNVQAVSGATSQEFEQLKTKAQEIGASTSKSASESADALGYMALAGWNTTQMLTGLEPILRASEAGGMELATCSDLITDSMSALGVTTDNLSHYLDIVTQAQNSSNTSMQGLLEAYINCGGTFKNLNVSLEESATLLGILANRGIKSAEAGTSLNSILVNLIGANSTAATAMKDLGVSAWDTDGNFIGVTETLKILQKALNNCTEQEKALFEAHIGGKTQMDTLQALLGGVTEEYDTLNQKINDCNGVMEATAFIMQDNLAGDFTTFKSQLEATGITVSDIITPNIRRLIQTLTDTLKSFNNLDVSTQKMIVSLVAFSAAIGPALKLAGTLSTTVSKAITTISSFANAVNTGKTAIQALNLVCNTNPIGLLVTALTVATTAYTVFSLTTENTTKKIQETTKALEENRKAYEETKNAIKDTTTAEEAKYDICEKLLPKLDELGNKTDRTAQEESELKRIIDQLNQAMPDLKLAIDNETGSLNMNTNAVRDNIDAYRSLAQAKGAQSLLENATTEKLKLEKKYESTGLGDKISALQNEIDVLNQKYDDNDIREIQGVPLGATNSSQAVAELTKLRAKEKELQELQAQAKPYLDELRNAEKEVTYYADKMSSLQKTADEKKDNTTKSNTTTIVKVKKSSELSDDVQSEIKTLEYKHSAGLISEEKYLQELTRIRDNYFINDSEGWNEYNAKIVNIRNKANKVSTTTATKTATELSKINKQAVNEELSLLEYKKSEGIITEQSYYNSLKKIRDSNYSYMDSDWRSITSKMATVQKSIYKSSLDEQEEASKNYIDRMEKNDLWGEDSASSAYERILNRYKEAFKNIDNIAWDSVAKRSEYEKYLTEKIISYTEQQEQAYKNAYNSRYSNSKDWISERNFYNDWDNYADNEIEAWKRVKEYTKQTYENGKLSYSDYAKQIKEIDKNIYSSSKTLANELVEKIKDSESKKLEAVKNKVAEEKELLQSSYNEDDREEQLKKLYTQEKYYRNSLTKEGQDKYNSILSEIKKLEREKELLAVEKKSEGEIAVAEQKYNELSNSAEELATIFIEKFSEGNSIAISKQAEALLEAEKQSEEFTKMEDEKINNLAETLAEGVNNIFVNYTDEQKKYINEQLKMLEDYKNKVENLFTNLRNINNLSSIFKIQSEVQKQNLGNNKEENNIYNYNHYGDYNFNDKKDLDIYNKEANSNMFSVFGR